MSKLYSIRTSLSKYAYRSIFVKIISVTLVAVIILFSMGFGVLIYFRRVLIRRELDSQQLHIEHAANQLDTSLSSAQNTLAQMLLDKKITSFAFSYVRHTESYRDYRRTADAMDILAALRNSNPYLSELFLCLRTRGSVLTSLHIYDYPSFLAKRFPGEEERWDALLLQRNNMTLAAFPSPASGEKCRSLFIINETSVTFGSAAGDAVVARLELDDLDFTDGVGENGVVCLLDKSFELLGFLSDPPNDGKPFEITDKLRRAGLAARNVSGEDGGYLWQLAELPHTDVLLLSLTPLDTIISPISTAFTIWSLALLVSLLVSLIISFILAGRISLPLQQTAELIQYAHGDDNDARPDELETIRRNVNGILANMDMMSKRSLDYAPLVLEAVLKKLILGIRDNENVEKLLRLLSIELREGLYIAACIRILDPDAPAQREQLTVDLKIQLGRCLSDNVISAFMCNSNEVLAVCRIDLPEERGGIIDNARELCRHLAADGVTALISVGGVQKRLSDIGASYDEAAQALELRPVSCKASTVLDAADMTPTALPYIPTDTENRLREYLLAGNAEVTRRLILAILAKNRELDVSFRDYLSVLATINGFVARIYSELDAEMCGDIELADPRLASAVRTGALEDAENAILGNCSVIAAFYALSMSDRHINAILKYVEDNLDRDLSLNEVAEHVGLSANYVTRYFKRKTGMNFKQYLTQKQIERSKELLLGTRLTIERIAAKCGYNSSKQFIAAFSKVTGVTPNRFRSLGRDCK